MIGQADKQSLPFPVMKTHKSGSSKDTNMVAAAVKAAGGPTKVANANDVSRQTVHSWIRAGSMAEFALRYALWLSKASGIALEKLTIAGGQRGSDDDEKGTGP
jgi:hypothetical protein